MMLKENKRVRDLIQPAFEPLMVPHINKLDKVLDPGLTMLTWTSINIELYTASVHEALGINK